MGIRIATAAALCGLGLLAGAGTASADPVANTFQVPATGFTGEPMPVSTVLVNATTGQSPGAHSLRHHAAVQLVERVLVPH